MERNTKSKRKSRSKRKSKSKSNSSPNESIVEATAQMETDREDETASTPKSVVAGSEPCSIPEKMFCIKETVNTYHPDHSLRWTGQLDDSEEESRRIELYKTRRRERYERAAASAATKLQSSTPMSVNLKIPNIYASAYGSNNLSDFYIKSTKRVSTAV